MPDIAKCIGSGCSVKEKCYRFTSKPSGEMQSWFLGVPGSDELCDWFWEDKPVKLSPEERRLAEALLAVKEMDEAEKET